jgi:hypothetical protein
MEPLSVLPAVGPGFYSIMSGADVSVSTTVKSDRAPDRLMHLVTLLYIVRPWEPLKQQDIA